MKFSEKTIEKIAVLFLALGLIGFLDAGFLTIEHYRAAPVPCSITEGCEEVLTSEYAQVRGIPVALFGSIYYFSIMVFSFLFLTRRGPWLLYASVLSAAGLAASLWFVYLQLFVIKAICQYCMLSAADSTVLFLASVVYLLNRFKINNIA